MADESSEVMLDINSLETEAARLLIPFLRTASLMKLYIYKENLPEIKEDDEEFDQLVKFLDLISVVEAASGLRGHGADKHMHSDQPTDETEVHMEDESTQMSFQVRFFSLFFLVLFAIIQSTFYRPIKGQHYLKKM